MIGIVVGRGRTMCGALSSNASRSRSDSRTSPNSPFSRYRNPPWIMRDGAALQPEQKSFRSTSSTRRPCNASSRIDTDAVDAAAHDHHVQGPITVSRRNCLFLCRRHSFPVRRRWRAVILTCRLVVGVGESGVEIVQMHSSQPRMALISRRPTGEFARPLRSPVPARRSARRTARK